MLQAPGNRKACTCKTRCIRSSCKCVKTRRSVPLRVHVSCKVACQLCQPYLHWSQKRDKKVLTTFHPLKTDSSVGDNLYQLTENDDNVNDDEMLMTDVEDVFDIDFDDDSVKIWTFYIIHPLYSVILELKCATGHLRLSYLKHWNCLHVALFVTSHDVRHYEKHFTINHMCLRNNDNINILIIDPVG